ncbi:DegV family protein [Petroclostridium sp. X23]|uniref:DegV family protein n=1 Tax=Petroclostridium sp. X23 TaxID=3045146 RepID=UPI0024AE4B26|nr:DegV family protein [Petroclostridium sp. X23]WHH60717.1 DegV family protein [Petroclostridium sp. X23]
MERIKVVTDSTSDIPKGLAEELDIKVVPLTVHFGDKSYKDWYDITSAEFFYKLENSDIMPTTSQVTPIAFEEAFNEALQDYDSIICITLSSKASGTYQSAVIAQNSLEDADIEVIDSMAFSFGYGMIVIEAAKMAKADRDKQEIVDYIHNSLKRLETYFIVDTLEYLKKGGRINLATAVIGNILSIKPVLGVRDGLVVPIDKVRGSKKVIPKMIELIRANGYDASDKMICLAHGAIPEKIEEVKEAIAREIHPKGFMITEVGSVIGAHAGPGIVGIFTIKD